MNQSNNDLLDRMEKIHDCYVDLVDKIPMEDKVIMSYEEATVGLEPWTISEIVQSALNNLPEGLEDHVDALFDIIYDAVSEALDKSRNND